MMKQNERILQDCKLKQNMQKEAKISIGCGPSTRRKVLIDGLELLCYFMKNDINRYLDDLSSPRSKLHIFARNIEKNSLEVTQWFIALQQERSSFNEFRRNVEVKWKTARHTKNNIEKDEERSLATQAENIKINVSTENVEREARKQSTRIEMNLFNRDTALHDKKRCLRMNNLYNARCKVKTQYLHQLVKYDNDIRDLYEKKIDLLQRKNFIESDYSITQSQLIKQRNLYRQLKAEFEMNKKQAFMAKLEQFCRNRAAKLIQRSWKVYRIRVCWKKKKGKR